MYESYAGVLVHALEHVEREGSFSRPLRVDVVGADTLVEAKWIPTLVSKYPLRLRLVGPNLFFPVAARPSSSVVVESFVRSTFEALPASDVDVVLFYHPGFYGYDSWTSTLKALPARTLCVVTSYTEIESIENFEFVHEACDVRMVWDTTKFNVADEGSKTIVEGREMVDNGFSFGFVKLEAGC